MHSGLYAGKTHKVLSSMISDLSVAILGAGLSGLAAAQRLQELGYQADIYERNSYVGGHAHSHVVDGFTFDEGPHVSFTEKVEIKSLLAEAVKGQYLEKNAVLLNHWNEYWVRHPAQCNLYGLPSDIVERCIIDIIKAQGTDQGPINTYSDWCRQGLGDAFSEEFTFRYTRKYWTTEASNMSVDWVGSRVYVPRIEEVVRGALRANTDNHHYITRFRYPARGGFGAYVQAFSNVDSIHVDHEVVLVDLKRRCLEFTNGKIVFFEGLISSLPLPELVRRIKDAPMKVVEAAERLSCTSLVLTNVGVRRTDGFPDSDWMYFYDDDIIFSRGNLPHRLSPNNVPPGCGSIQVEVYHSKYRPLPCDDVLNRSIEDMHRIGLLVKDDQVVVAHQRHVPYANVLFDLQRSANLGIVQSYLADRGVVCCGRYGEWAYYWSDDSIQSGWNAAQAILA